MISKKITLAIGLALGVSGISRLHAQNVIIRHDTLYSPILQEKRPLEIDFAKDDTAQNTEPYEAICVLDGISDFARLEWLFLQGEGFIPKHTILIGIDNTFNKDGADLRDRDFTPTRLYPNSGGAANFLAFFKQELLPHIEKQYHVKKSGNTLYGGSLGGLFVVYTYLHDPELFTSYMAVDPSLWWDNFLEHKEAAKKLDSLGSGLHTLWIVGRAGSPYHFMGTAGMDSLLQKKALAGLSWKVSLYENDTHYSTNFKGFYEGLKFSYGGFYASTGGYSTSRAIAIKPMGGIVIRDQPFSLSCYNLAPQYYLHYTTNGQMPTGTSPLLSGDKTPFTLDSSCRFTVKSIGARSEYDKQASADFRVVPAALAPVPPGKDLRQGGLHYTSYEGTWTQLPDLKKLKPTQSGFADSAFEVSKLYGQQNTVCILDGYLKIDRPGYYIFEMGDGNENSRIELNHILILGPHFQKGWGESFMVPLEKGYYPFKVSYFHKKGENTPEPLYLKFGAGDDFPLPNNMLFGLN